MNCAAGWRQTSTERYLSLAALARNRMPGYPARMEQLNRASRDRTAHTAAEDAAKGAAESAAEAPAGSVTGAEITEDKTDDASGSPTLNLLQVISSVLAAGLGVQSSRNRERDFEQGRAGTFIVAGLVFTALFIGGVYTVVSLVLAGR